MSARVDKTPFSTVAWCVDCPSWSEAVHDVEAGHRVAVDHEARVHPASRAAEMNQFKFLHKVAKLAA